MKLARNIALMVVIGSLQAVVPAAAQTSHRYSEGERNAFVATRACESSDFFARLFGLSRGDCVEPYAQPRVIEQIPYRGIQITGLNGI